MQLKKNANVRFVQRLHDLYLEPLMRSLFTHMDPAKRNQDLVVEKFLLFNKRLSDLERICLAEDSKQNFFCGEQFTFAECVLPPTLMMSQIMAEELRQPFNLNSKENPKVFSWWIRIQKHSSVAPILEIASVATLAWVGRKKEGSVSKCSL